MARVISLEERRKPFKTKNPDALYMVLKKDKPWGLEDCEWNILKGKHPRVGDYALFPYYEGKELILARIKMIVNAAQIPDVAGVVTFREKEKREGIRGHNEA